MKLQARTKVQLQNLINNYFRSDHYVITDGLKVYNSYRNEYLKRYQVEYRRKQWVFLGI